MYSYTSHFSASAQAVKPFAPAPACPIYLLISHLDNAAIGLLPDAPAGGMGYTATRFPILLQKEREYGIICVSAVRGHRRVAVQPGRAIAECQGAHHHTPLFVYACKGSGTMHGR